tara:strand:- start:3043 stop:3678 length:636 start_codon:yes stop_codon:yes gene_type:complete
MKKIILWDFDGVILNSNIETEFAFRYVLQNHSKDEIEQLLDFHNMNGGLSRYVKFKYFYNNIINENLTDSKMNLLTNSFSEIRLKRLSNPKLLILDTLKFIKNNYDKYLMHIVSGSDGTELRSLCNNLEIAKYFNSIDGSPTPKNQLISELLKINNYNPDYCVLIGDSINDFQAAELNDIKFFGYNNSKIKNLGDRYLTQFDDIFDSDFLK